MPSTAGHPRMGSALGIHTIVSKTPFMRAMSKSDHTTREARITRSRAQHGRRLRAIYHGRLARQACQPLTRRTLGAASPRPRGSPDTSLAILCRYWCSRSVSEKPTRRPARTSRSKSGDVDGVISRALRSASGMRSDATPPSPLHLQNILRGVSSMSFRKRSVWIAWLLPKPKVLELLGHSAFNRT